MDKLLSTDLNHLKTKQTTDSKIGGPRTIRLMWLGLLQKLPQT